LIAVAAMSLALAWPLYGFGGLFMQDAANDAIRAPAWHQLVASQLLHLEGLGSLRGWNWPGDQPTVQVMPSTFDGVAVAPLWWALGWPGAWRAEQALAIVINGVGGAWLARAMGARAGGMLLAGVLMALCPVAWREVLLGHPNTAVPGLAAIALATFLEAVARGGWRIGLAGAAGALAAGFFPPFLLLLAPPGGLALLASRPDRRGWMRAAGSLGVGALLGAPVLWGMIAMRAEKGVEGFAATCPQPGFVTLGADVAAFGPPAWVGEIDPWLAAGIWLGLPAVALARRSRAVLLGWALFACVLAVVSLGPCPSWGPVAGVERSLLLGWTGPLVGVMNALGRLLIVAHLLLGTCLALAWDAPGLRGVAAKVLGALALLGVALPLRGELLDHRHYKRVEVSPQAAFLAGVAPAPIADLPWDQAGQFVVALQTPGFPRVNPPTPYVPKYRDDPFVAWLHDLSAGSLPPSPPTPAQAAASGVRWVFHDTRRCDPPRMNTLVPCSAAVRSALAQVLGRGRDLGSGVMVWEVPGGDRP
jgi:hypothetical protein